MSRNESDEVWDEVAQMIVDIILDRDKLEEYFSSDKVTQPEAFSFDVFPSSCAKKGKMSLQLSSGHNDVSSRSIATELDTVAPTDGHSNDFTQRACSDSCIHIFRPCYKKHNVVMLGKSLLPIIHTDIAYLQSEIQTSTWTVLL